MCIKDEIDLPRPGENVPLRTSMAFSITLLLTIADPEYDSKTALIFRVPSLENEP